jgi:hypothetical protein
MKFGLRLLAATLIAGLAAACSTTPTPGVCCIGPVTGEGCALASVIAGPIGVVGAMNINPSFANPQIARHALD